MYTLEIFSVNYKKTGKHGLAQFDARRGVMDIKITMDDGDSTRVHMDDLQEYFHCNYVEFVNAKAEKILFDNGRLTD